MPLNFNELITIDKVLKCVAIINNQSFVVWNYYNHLLYYYILIACTVASISLVLLLLLDVN